MSASPSMCAPHAARAEPFLAADVGGTHVRVGLMQPGPTEGDPSILDYRTYRCADYPGLGDILATFMRESGQPSVQVGIIASAGYALEDGQVITSNLPWPLQIEHTRHMLSMRTLRLVNDFEAVAYAAPQMARNEVLHVCGPRQALRAGPALVFGPGTGLGAAVWIPTPTGEVVLSTEAGQATLSAVTEVEADVLRALRRTREHVTVEHVISGPGLLTLYRTLCELRGVTPACATPADVTTSGLAGSDAVATQALEVFTGLLGSVLGDLALLYGIQQGIYLAGGFLPQLAPLLVAGGFAERFLAKGNMRPALEQVPVKVIEHGRLGVIGAAIWLQRNAAPDLAWARG